MKERRKTERSAPDGQKNKALPGPPVAQKDDASPLAVLQNLYRLIFLPDAGKQILIDDNHAPKASLREKTGILCSQHIDFPDTIL